MVKLTLNVPLEVEYDLDGPVDDSGTGMTVRFRGKQKTCRPLLSNSIELTALSLVADLIRDQFPMR